MKNVWLYGIIVLAAILAFSHYLAYRLGKSQQELVGVSQVAGAAMQVVQTQQAATSSVDSADSCAVKRMLCKAARGGCDTKRVCD